MAGKALTSFSRDRLKTRLPSRKAYNRNLVGSCYFFHIARKRTELVGYFLFSFFQPMKK